MRAREHLKPAIRRSLDRSSGMLMSLVILVTALSGGTVRSQPSAGDEVFLTRVYTNATGNTLPYRLLLPERYDASVAYPVVLYLHGAAARGRDNREPLNWGPRLFLDASIRKQHAFILVVPQAPRESGWAEASWGSGAGLKPSQSLSMALELVETALPREFRVDSKRRYLTGVSMGGHAVWGVMVLRPGLFAAAVPVCAGGNPRMVTDAAARFPVWAFHSDDDHLVPVQQARAMVKAWRDHGGVARYTEYTGLKHSSWKKAYVDLALYDWLFEQKAP